MNKRITGITTELTTESNVEIAIQLETEFSIKVEAKLKAYHKAEKARMAALMGAISESGAMPVWAVPRVDDGQGGEARVEFTESVTVVQDQTVVEESEPPTREAIKNQVSAQRKTASQKKDSREARKAKIAATRKAQIAATRKAQIAATRKAHGKDEAPAAYLVGGPTKQKMPHSTLGREGKTYEPRRAFQKGYRETPDPNKKKTRAVLEEVNARKRSKFNVPLSDHFPNVVGGTKVVAQPAGSAAMRSASVQVEFYLAQSMRAIRQAALAMITPQAKRYGVSVEDLESVGIIAAIEAVAKYDPKQASFLGFATPRIRGSMLDCIRDACPAPRTQTDRIRAHLAQASAVADHTNRTISTDDPYDNSDDNSDDTTNETTYDTTSGATRDTSGPVVEIDTKSREFRRHHVNMSMAMAAVNQLSLDSPLDVDNDLTLHDIKDLSGFSALMYGGQITAEESLQLKEVIDRLTDGHGVKSSLVFSDQERLVVEMTLQGFSRKEIARCIGVYASRASQVLASATDKMSSFAKLDRVS